MVFFFFSVPQFFFVFVSAISECEWNPLCLIADSEAELQQANVSEP